MAAIGINWHDIWAPVWADVWQQTTVTQTASVYWLSVRGTQQRVAAPSRKRGLERSYVYKGRRYLLTPDELARMIAMDAIDVAREDIKIVYKDRKPHPVSRNAWKDLKATIARLTLPVDISGDAAHNVESEALARMQADRKRVFDELMRDEEDLEDILALL